MKWLSDNVIHRLREEVSLPDLRGTKYQVIRKIASGGMGTVYLAKDVDLDRLVALKVVTLPDSSGELASRVLREARIAARLEHPSIVPVHDVAQLADGRVFYTMKFIQGHRLDHYLRDKSSLSDRLRIFQKICEAVAFAHAHGVIHRDLKPENVMVGPFGEVLVMDWGIAKVLYGPGDGPEGSNRAPKTFLSAKHVNQECPSGQEPFRSLDSSHDSALDLSSTHSQARPILDTAIGTVLGTPAYMAPEQALGKTDQLDERTDVYALGAILYFLLTDRHPWNGYLPGSAGHSFPADALLPPRRFDGNIPRSIEAVCLKAMSRISAHRYAGAQELASDISRFLDQLPVSAYPEHFYERAERWLWRNHFLIFVVLAYLLMRIFIFWVTRR